MVPARDRLGAHTRKLARVTFPPIPSTTTSTPRLAVSSMMRATRSSLLQSMPASTPNSRSRASLSAFDAVGSHSLSSKCTTTGTFDSRVDWLPSCQLLPMPQQRTSLREVTAQ